MEKQPRKKKPLNVSLDTKNVDVTITRDENGKLDIDVDTKKIDVHFTKDENGVSLDIEVDDQLEYEFEANGKAEHLPKGTVWKVTGEILKIFLKQGFGKLKK
jgi:hypothetical protein